MTIGFFPSFFFGGVGVVFWREKEETDEMTEKNEPFEAQHQKEHWLDEMPVPQKTLKSACLHPPAPLHPHPRLSGFELGGCYLSHFKSGRGGEGLFTF